MHCYLTRRKSSLRPLLNSASTLVYIRMPVVNKMNHLKYFYRYKNLSYLNIGALTAKILYSDEFGKAVPQN